VSRQEEREKKGPTQDRCLQLRLYVAGDAPNSVEARANLEAICSQNLEPGTYELEVIDVLEEPLRALDDGILVTPTLVNACSSPVSIIGTLEDHDRVKQALGLK
jgi:circadian clock protein KaiB